MGAVGAVGAGKRFEQAWIKSDQRPAFAVLEFRIHRERAVAEGIAVDRRRSANVPLAPRERPGGEVLLRRADGLRRIEQDVALGLGQHGVALGVKVEGRPALALDEEAGEIGGPAPVTAIGCNAGADLRRRRAEALAKDDVHDLLVGVIAIFERDFLGQDLDPLDRFGRDVAELPEAGNPLPV